MERKALTSVWVRHYIALMFKTGIFHMKSLVSCTVAQLFKDGACEQEKNPKEQLACQSRFQRLIFMKTISKQQPAIQEQNMVQQMPCEWLQTMSRHRLSPICFLSPRKDFLTASIRGAQSACVCSQEKLFPWRGSEPRFLASCGKRHHTHSGGTRTESQPDDHVTRSICPDFLGATAGVFGCSVLFGLPSPIFLFLATIFHFP